MTHNERYILCEITALRQIFKRCEGTVAFLLTSMSYYYVTNTRPIDNTKVLHLQTSCTVHVELNEYQ